MPRRYRTLKHSGQRIDPKSGRFMRKVKASSIGSSPPADDGKTVDEHLRALFSAKKFAKSLLERAYAGDPQAQRIVHNATTSAAASSQYDPSRLSLDEQLQLQMLLAKMSTNHVQNSPSP